jgi:hypothetical protein
MTTGPYKVAEVEDVGDAACICSACSWTGPAAKAVEVESCALTPGDASPVGRCPDCDCLAYLATQTDDPQLLAITIELDAYLRKIRTKELDGSEPALGELLERSSVLNFAPNPDEVTL